MIEVEQAIKDIISENWCSHWGNSMGSAQRDELERQTLETLKNIHPHPLNIILAALAKVVSS